MKSTTPIRYALIFLMAASACGNSGQISPTPLSVNSNSDTIVQAAIPLDIGQFAAWGPIYLENDGDSPISDISVKPVAAGTTFASISNIYVAEVGKSEIMGVMIAKWDEIDHTHYVPLAGYELERRDGEVEVVVKVAAQARGTSNWPTVEIDYTYQGRRYNSAASVGLRICTPATLPCHAASVGS